MASWQGGDAISFFSSRSPDEAEQELVTGAHPGCLDHPRRRSAHWRVQGDEVLLPGPFTLAEVHWRESILARGGWGSKGFGKLMARGHQKRKGSAGVDLGWMWRPLVVGEVGEGLGSRRI